MAQVVKFMDGQDTAAKADQTKTIQTEMAALKTNWGTNYDVNMVHAKSFLDTLGKAAGLTPDQIKVGWDAISKTGGIGASYAMEMLRVGATKTGEPTFITPPGGPAGGPLSQAAARAEIQALNTDKAFGARLLDGGREERRKWDDLHAVAFPRPTAA